MTTHNYNIYSIQWVSMISMHINPVTQFSPGQLFVDFSFCKLSNLICFIFVCIRVGRMFESLLLVQANFSLFWVFCLFIFLFFTLCASLFSTSLLHHQNLKYASKQAAYVTGLQSRQTVYFLPNRFSQIYAYTHAYIYKHAVIYNRRHKHVYAHCNAILIHLCHIYRNKWGNPWQTWRVNL